MHLLIDTGATTTFISTHSLRRIAQYTLLHKNSSSFILADGTAPFHTSGVVQLTITFANHSTIIPAHIVSNLCADLILGMDYINKYNLSIDVKQQVVSIDFHSIVLSMPLDQDHAPRTIPAIIRQSSYLPPNGSRSVHIALPPNSSLPVFTPDFRFEKNHGLFVTHQFLPLDPRTTTLNVYNTSAFPQLISKGSCIGYLTYSLLPNQRSQTSALVSGRCDATSSTGAISVSTSFATTTTSHQALPFLCTTMPPIEPKVQDDIHQLPQDVPDINERQRLLSLLHHYHRVFDTTSHNIANTPINHGIGQPLSYHLDDHDEWSLLVDQAEPSLRDTQEESKLLNDQYAASLLDDQEGSSLFIDQHTPLLLKNPAVPVSLQTPPIETSPLLSQPKPTRSLAANARRNKKKHDKTRLQQRLHIMKRNVHGQWTITQIKAALDHLSIRYGRLCQPTGHVLHLQFNTDAYRLVAESQLPYDVFDEHHYRQWLTKHS
jgi:hypothetical protein